MAASTLQIEVSCGTSTGTEPSGVCMSRIVQLGDCMNPDYPRAIRLQLVAQRRSAHGSACEAVGEGAGGVGAGEGRSQNVDHGSWQNLESP